MAYESWIEEGVKKVYQHRAYLDAARRMLAMGFTVEDVIAVTKLSAAEVEALTASV